MSDQPAGSVRQQRPTVAMIGVGVMGEAVLAGLLRDGWTPEQVRPVVRRPEHARQLRERHGVQCVDLAVAVESEVVVVATKPAAILGVLDELAPTLRRDAVVASLAAGVTIGAMAARLPPGVAVVRVMPNTPSVVGAGMSVLSAGPTTTEAQFDLVDEVMSAVGSTMRIPEGLQNAATAVSGSGPAYLFYVVDAMAEAGVLLGLTRVMARELAIQTLLGSATLLVQSGRHPVELREQVSSPGGTTVAALRVLDDRGVRAAFLAAMEACRDRAVELGRPADQEAAAAVGNRST